MKHSMCLLVVLLLLATTLGGCGKNETAGNDSATSTTLLSVETPKTLPACSFTKLDHSLKNENGDMIFLDTYDLLVVEGNTPAVKAVNQFMNEQADAFFNDRSRLSKEDVLETADADFPYRATQTFTVDYQSERFLSISGLFSWYMGGTADYGTTSYTFDMNTGKLATLPDLTGIDAATLKEKVQSQCVTKLAEYYGDEFGYGDPKAAEQQIRATELADFSYCIQDGKIGIIFSKYEYACGAAGPYIAFTDLPIVG